MPELDTVPRAALTRLRHPLLVLDGVDAVPSAIELEPGTALVISGPNAGGKTVALKALGLAALMLRAGLPIPVGDRSRLGWFSPVLADIGDEQSLSRSLSTFSAHLTRLAAITEAVAPASLVLLDELCAGTDPEEGAALARALLESLVSRGAIVIVTTHYERLKELAVEDERFVNASVGFDLDRFTPDFRLSRGVPGPSSALHVAARFGVAPSIVERARALVPEFSRERERVVLALRAEERKLHQAREAAEAAVLERERALEEARELERRVEALAERELGREARELTARVRQARSRLEAAEKALTGATHKDELRAAEREISAAAAEVALGSALHRRESDRNASGEAPAPEVLRPGVKLRLVELGKLAELVEILPKDRLRVVTGGLKLSVPRSAVRLADLPGAARTGDRSSRPRPQPSRTSVKAEVTPMRHGENTLDLRGERVEEALSLVDDFIAALTLNQEDHGYVLHGHGTGALKAAVREHLRASPLLAWSRAADRDDGADAFTVFELRG